MPTRRARSRSVRRWGNRCGLDRRLNGLNRSWGHGVNRDLDRLPNGCDNAPSGDGNQLIFLPLRGDRFEGADAHQHQFDQQSWMPREAVLLVGLVGMPNGAHEEMKAATARLFAEPVCHGGTRLHQ